jgi:hypothetical protein
MASTWNIHTEGWLPGWAGFVLFLLISGFLLFQLRRELCQTRPSFVTRIVLPGIRFAICGLAVWLLCQPVITRVDRTTKPARFMLLTAGGQSLQTTESFDDLGRKIDLLENLTGKTLESRTRNASRLARSAQAVITLLSRQQDNLRKEMANLEFGLPLNPEVGRQIPVFGQQLDSLTDAMPADPESAAPKNEAFRKKFLAVQADRRGLVGRLGALSGDCDLVARESSEHPEVLGSFLDRIGLTLDAAQQLRSMALELQTEQDRQRITAADRAWVEQPLTRRKLTTLAAEFITRQLGPDVQLDLQSAPSLESALIDARRFQTRTSLDGIILLSDSTGFVTPAEDALSQQFSASDILVHALLIGNDGVAPQDAGLVALDMPGVLLRNQEITARVLVKSELPEDTDCSLEVRSGVTVIATRKLPAEQRGQFVLEIPLHFAEIGRHQLQFELRTAKPDAYAGNEELVQTVDVLPRKLQVLLISDRITNDFAAYKSALATMPTVNLQTVLAVPDLRRIKIGKESGAFPGQIEEWAGIDRVVLLGGIPDALIEKGKTHRESSVLKAFGQAVKLGLHVVVHEAENVKQERSWSALLGLAPTPDAQLGFVEPADGLWLDLHQLGLDELSSREQWERFGRIRTRSLEPATGLPILTAGDRAVLSIVRRGAGLLVYNGLPPITSLTQKGNSASATRLLHGILNLALRPLPVPGASADAAVVFPPQPVLGKDVVVWPGDLKLDSKSAALRLVNDPFAPRGTGRFTLTVAAPGPNDIPAEQPLRFAAGGRELLVAAPVNLVDFGLTPNSAPLKRLAMNTGGAYADLNDPTALIAAMKKAEGQTFERTWVLRMWRGWWSLVLLLGLVSAEYLLRRQAGRVM